ncbi:Sulfate/bicarbonate/oxalate exchanger SAT-1 and related transporters (SLC26 family) [Phaffia rhodozyma]|uniref:Sulfate/bicarbonate/oxalate exchanger SAT-1 and related transporters (SLC26 family) n=1 Tax=Phaffia rhodozyma TaxID=264483 RepID=A0A0F7SIX1_PHARH|nr:Sulfate/bicarbonate/oxalate exchanger SAT-1 and related transporters (SLC26 family) [Phaffia rhodozyma]
MSGTNDNKVVYYAKRIIGYEEDAPGTASSKDYLGQLGSNPKGKALEYFKSLFPFLQWLPNYNLQWLVGDLIAGITVGLVLVPQSMSYAKLANLSPEYGLYSSFVGVFVYAFFATSKDVSIGPVAVMSLETGRIVAEVLASHPGKWAAEDIATCLAFVCGFIVLGIGLLRLGWIVEFIPVPAVAGFMTGSAINIVSGQVPGLFGISSLFNTKAATYLVIINTFKFLHKATLDAALGVPALVGLYAMKWTCNYAEKRYPRYRRVAFFVSVTRNALIVVIFTITAWQVVKHKHKGAANPVSVLKTVPSGFKHVGAPLISSELISAFAGKLPVATVILLLEHIAISKSFGRINNYKINPNQELIAIGVTNTVGTLFNAYPATGSFSRSALKSKSGVRTPAAGWATGVIVIIALYALTDAFYYIPNAALSAIIIHAVADLVVSPKGAYAFWKVSPFEFFIWLASVLVSVFATIEIGIYTSLASSLVLLLFRIARPGGHFLGRVRVGVDSKSDGGETGSIHREYRDVFVPFSGQKKGVTNPQIKVEQPPPGVVIYRFEESFIYPNASFHNSALVDYIKTHTRRGRSEVAIKLGDRPWNDSGPNRWSKKAKAKAAVSIEDDERDGKYLIRAIVLDFQAVANLDTTGVQNLVDTKKEIERYANAPVSFHFSGIVSPWVQRALVAGGFGIGTQTGPAPAHVATVVPQFSDNLRSVQDDPEGQITLARNTTVTGHQRRREEYAEEKLKAESLDGQSEVFEPLISSKTPYFHFDLEEAVRAATADARRERPVSEDFDVSFSAH